MARNEQEHTLSDIMRLQEAGATPREETRLIAELVVQGLARIAHLEKREREGHTHVLSGLAGLACLLTDVQQRIARLEAGDAFARADDELDARCAHERVASWRWYDGLDAGVNWCSDCGALRPTGTPMGDWKSPDHPRERRSRRIESLRRRLAEAEKRLVDAEDTIHELREMNERGRVDLHGIGDGASIIPQEAPGFAMCGEWERQHTRGGGWTNWQCTAPKHHHGDHVAADNNGVVRWAWPNKSPSASPEVDPKIKP